MSEQVKGQEATLERKALAALRKMREKLNEIEDARTEPIAIVGVGCRFPGGANDPEALWDLLRNGVDAIREVPADRWKAEEYFDPNPGTPGKTYSRWGGFMDQIDHFDSEFFGISPREAVHMDPQQRIFLEVAWEALEDAGIPPHSLTGTSTGVFVGATMADYLQQRLRHGNPSDLDAYIISGNTINAISGRLAYFLGTHGPSISLDTACSSSLVAVDRACRSLRDGECTLAIAGGVNLILAPDLFVCTSKWGMLSPDGRCKTFDAAANGFVRAEGCGIIILKRLGAALTDGDRILALIRGSAVNQDGPSSGLSVPNGLAQEALIRQALRSARVEPSALSYVEAHGTGTSLGDPIEVEALARVFQPDRNAQTPVALGSVKTNLGHLEAASGIAGLLKVVLMLGHRQIPPHLHLKRPSPHIAWEKYPFVIHTQLTNWEPLNGKRIAGVSSFGATGSNAHVILEEAPEAKPDAGGVERPLQLLTLSARDENALCDLTTGFVARLQRVPHPPFPDVCFSANTGRAQFSRRLSVLCSTAEEAREKLTAFLAGEAPAGLMTSRLSGSARPKIAFLFTGQGAQYAGMGLRLYETSPTFRKSLDKCDKLLRPHLDKPLLSLLYSQDTQSTLLDHTIYTQPAVFALEYALYELWSSWGLLPDFVMGHSVGEYVAACVAGIFTLEHGLKLVVQRARLMQVEPQGGGMVAVRAGEEQVRAAMEPFARTVSIAAINGPHNTVISGAVPDMEAIVNRLAAAGVQTKNLNVSHAFHSPLMEPVLAPFEKAVVDIGLQPPAIRLISNLTGRIAKAEEITQPAYWRNQLREPVRFSAGIQTLVESGCDIFLELGPSPVLLAMGRQCTSKPNTLWLPTLREGRDDWSESLTSLQALHHVGVPVNWKGFDGDYPRRRIQLPTYPFQRERFWFESRRERADNLRTSQCREWTGTHPLLGVRLRSPALGDAVFQSRLSAEHPVFHADDQVCRRVTLPAAAYLEMVLEGAHRLFGEGAHRVENLCLLEALQLEVGTEACVQVIFQAKDEVSAAFEIFSSPGDGQDADAPWIRHVNGRVAKSPESEMAEVKTAELQAVRDRCTEFVDTTALYQNLNEQGFGFGRAFRNVKALWRGTTETLAEISLADSLQSGAGLYRFHPALLDACFQAAVQVLYRGARPPAEEEFFLPVKIERVRISRGVPTAFWSHGRLRGTPGSEATEFTLDLEVYDSEGRTLGEIAGLQLKRANRRMLDRTLRGEEQDWLFEIQWREVPPADKNMQEPASRLSQPGSWLMLTDERGLAESLRTRLISAGQRCLLARAGPTFVCQGNDQFVLDPANRGHFERLLEEADITAETPLRGVLHLWTVEFPEFDSMTGEALARSELLGCGAALHLIQALGSLKADPPLCIWLVTQGAQAVSDSSGPIHAAMTSLWGLRQVIAVEHPELSCRLIDLDQQSAKDGGEILFRELARGDSGEDSLAFRNRSRLVPRLVRLPSATATAAYQQQIPVGVHSEAVAKPAPGLAAQTSPTKRRLRDDATYLITGGLGGLGLETARWMAREGARNIVLMGRRAADPKANAALDELAGCGAAITIEQCDVSDESGLSASLNRISTSMPALRGIVHAAGVLDDGILEQQTWSRFAGVMAAKVRGAWNLHRLTSLFKLDFFVLFSSAASVIGSPGQGSYAAANAFMDGLAHHRKSKGLPALSINWGAWAEAGMAARLAKKDAERWVNLGLRPIRLDEGMAKLGELLVSSRAQIVAVPIDWSKFFASRFSGRPPSFFSEIITASGTETLTGEEASLDDNNVVRRLFGEPAGRRLEILKAHVESAAARALGARGAKSLDPRRPLHEMGLDSLLSVELRNALAASLGRSLSATLLFDYPTVESLANHLARNVLNLELPDETASEDCVSPDNRDLQALREMSESEAESLLLAELDQLKK